MQKRTTRQNASLHRLFENISTHCLAHGIDMQTVLEHMKEHRCHVSPEAVKSTWKDIQKTVLETDKTSMLERGEIDKVYMEFAKLWGEITKTDFPFPSYEALIHTYEESVK